MKILLTGFEPFGGDGINPSWEAVSRVRETEGIQLIRRRLPVSFQGARALLRQEIEAHRPDMVLCTGLAGGRDGFSLERVAVNMMDARIPDNEGFQPQDEPVLPGEAAAYFSTLALRPMLANLQEAGIPASISNTAGLYVCNAVFYEAARLQAAGVIKRAGFIHLPYLPEQGAEKDKPFLPLKTMTEGLERVMKVNAYHAFFTDSP